MNARTLCFHLALLLSLPWICAAKRHVRGTVPLTKAPPKGVPNQKSTAAYPESDVRPTKKYGKEYPGEKGGKLNEGDLPGIGPGRCEEKHPIETFVQISSAHSPQASRLGGVYFLSDLREVPQVFYLKEPNGWPEQVSFFPDGVPYFKVGPDGRKVLIATQSGGDEQYDIHLLEPAGGNVLTPLIVDRNKRVESVAWAPSGKWFAFTSNARNKTDMDLYRFDLATRTTQLLVELKGAHSVTDISPNGNLVALEHYRSVADGDVLVLDIEKKTLTNITAHSGDISYGDGKFTGDSKSILVLSDVEKGVRQLFVIPLEEGKSERMLTSGSWEVEGFSLDDSRNQLAYVVNEEGYGRIGGYQIDSAGRRGKTLQVPSEPASIQRTPSFAFGKSRGFFYARSSSVQSSDIWFWQHPKKTRWTQSTHGLIRGDCFVQEKLVRYPSFDKREIPAFLYYPRDMQGPVPFIVYIHGGPEAQYRPTFSKIFQYFLERGFGVFAPNVRGSTGYGREFTQLDNHRKRMDSVQDAIEGARWLLANRYSQAGKLAIYGGSYGGFMVLRSIEVEPTLFSAAAESVGITNFVTFLKNTKPYRRALREAEYGPLSDEAFLTSISPMTHLDAIKTPLMIFHGANDPRVPVSEAEQIIAELKRREIPVEFKIFEDEGHGNTKLRNIMEQARTMAYFFEKYFKKEEAAK